MNDDEEPRNDSPELNRVPRPNTVFPAEPAQTAVSEQGAENFAGAPEPAVSPEAPGSQEPAAARETAVPAESAAGSRSAESAGDRPSAAPPPAGAPDAAEQSSAAALDQTIDRLQAEIETLKLGEADQRDAALRQRAEMDNLRKRTTRDIERAHKYALESFIRDLLPVLDSMELGVQSVSHDDRDSEGWREGMELTIKMLRDLLQRFQVHAIEPVGVPFDPEFHEAVSVQSRGNDDESSREIVVTVLQKGYLLHERLIRPAKVVISR